MKKGSDYIFPDQELERLLSFDPLWQLLSTNPNQPNAIAPPTLFAPLSASNAVRPSESHIGSR
jgi:hypothetical protein